MGEELSGCRAESIPIRVGPGEGFRAHLAAARQPVRHAFEQLVGMALEQMTPRQGLVHLVDGVPGSIGRRHLGYHFLDLAAQAFEHTGRFSHRGLNLLLDRPIPEAGGETDPIPREFPIEGGGKVRQAVAQTQRISRIMATGDREEQGRILDVAGERPTRQEQRPIAETRVVGDQSVGGLAPEGAAESGGNGDRAARVAASCHRCEPRRDCTGGAATRPTDGAVEIPGIAAGWSQQVSRLAEHGELWRVGFTNDDCTGRAESLDQDRVLVRHEVPVDERTLGGA